MTNVLSTYLVSGPVWACSMYCFCLHHTISQWWSYYYLQRRKLRHKRLKLFAQRITGSEWQNPDLNSSYLVSSQWMMAVVETGFSVRLTGRLIGLSVFISVDHSIHCACRVRSMEDGVLNGGKRVSVWEIRSLSGTHSGFLGSRALEFVLHHHTPPLS